MTRPWLAVLALSLVLAGRIRARASAAAARRVRVGGVVQYPGAGAHQVSLAGRCCRTAK